jgi:hypothetical protein
VATGASQGDKSHLTVAINPGGHKCHIYLDPEDGTSATENSQIVRITVVRKKK